MPQPLKKAEEIAHKLKLELLALPQEQVFDHFRSQIDEIPEEYKALVDGMVAATLVYGLKANGSNPKQPKVTRWRPNLNGWVFVAFLVPVVIVALNVFPLAQSESEPSGRDELRELRNDGRDNLIVFVHGLRDNGNLTWTNGETKVVWPEMLSKDDRFEGFDISSYHYSSMLFQNGSLSVSHVADQLAFRLDQNLVDKYENIVFVAHSMGGLVVRNLLIKNDFLSDKVPLIYFLATPTAGSDIARLAKVIDLGNSQLDAMTSFEQSNFLQDQASAWRASKMFSEVYSLCAFENKLTIGVLVVDQASAQSLCTERTVPSEESHSGIAKPYSENSIVYKAFADRVVATLGVVP